MENQQWNWKKSKETFIFTLKYHIEEMLLEEMTRTNAWFFSQSFWFFQLFPTEYFQNTRANSIIKQWTHLWRHSRMHCSPQNVIRFDRCYAYTRLQKHVQRATCIRECEHISNAYAFALASAYLERVICLLDLHIFASNCIDVYVSHIKCTYACLYCVYACVWHLPISVGFFLQQTS